MKRLIIVTFNCLLLIMLVVQTASSQTEVKPFHKNRLSLGVIDMALGEIGFKYERLIGNGQAGLFIPVNISYYEGSWYDYDNKFYSGLGLNYYPTGQGLWKYYCGMELNIGYGSFYHSYDYWNPIWGGYYSRDKVVDGAYTRFLINNGIQYAPTREFSVDVHLGLGFRNVFVDELTKDEKVSPNATLGLNLSYWF